MKTSSPETQSPAHLDVALLLLRLMVGAVFVFHGSQKLFGASGLEGFAGYLKSVGMPWPHLNAGLAASAEFFGGLALLSGAGVRWAAWPLVGTMLVACYVLRSAGFDAQQGGMEFPLTLAVVTACVGLLGSGRYTVGRVLNWAREKAQPLQLGESSWS